RGPRRRPAPPASSCGGCCRCMRRNARLPERLGPPTQSIRVRGVIVRDGALLMDRTHHDDRERFYWLPGGGLEPGETSEECLRRELMEEAALEIRVDRLLYLSENLFVESGDYRHELILYYLAEIASGPHGTPSDPRMHEWHRPGEQ